MAVPLKQPPRYVTGTKTLAVVENLGVSSCSTRLTAHADGC